jgi:hypothetical protein
MGCGHDRCLPGGLRSLLPGIWGQLSGLSLLTPFGLQAFGRAMVGDGTGIGRVGAGPGYWYQDIWNAGLRCVDLALRTSAQMRHRRIAMMPLQVSGTEPLDALQRPALNVDAGWTDHLASADGFLGPSRTQESIQPSIARATVNRPSARRGGNVQWQPNREFRMQNHGSGQA